MPATPDGAAPKTPSPARGEGRGGGIALGFDYGRVRIGVAIGEAVTGSARPLAILPTRQQQPDWPAIARLIQDWRPDHLVVGVPRQADDSANAMTEAALHFSRQLQQRFQVPVATIDERLSSWEAQQRHFETAPTKRRRPDSALDAQAAAVILESWFNHQRSTDASWATPNS